MSLPKKGSRTILVENSEYRWMASGNDGYIDLYIEPSDNGQPLKAKFNYHHIEVEKKEGGGLKQQFSVTPDIVQQAIIIGLNKSWNPLKNGAPLDLHFIDDLINWKK